MVDLGGGLANERSERSFFLAIERITGIKSDKKKLGVTPHFSRSKILNNHQLGMNNQPIIIKFVNNPSIISLYKTSNGKFISIIMTLLYNLSIILNNRTIIFE